MSEILEEHGVVLETSAGLAVVRIERAADCEECSAKLFCQTTPASERVLTIRDDVGVAVGDAVEIHVRGSSVLRASLLLYGVPLVLLLAGVVAGMRLWAPPGLPREAWSALVGVVLAALWFGGVLVRAHLRKRRPPLPVAWVARRRPIT